jgi:maleylpyruvate isomerase
LTTRRWMRDGQLRFGRAVAGLSDESLTAITALPGWTRAHVVAHVAANADALNNLVHWAATGIETPMYASPAERVAGIEKA